jgi:hypothetical protein
MRKTILALTTIGAIVATALSTLAADLDDGYWRKHYRDYGYAYQPDYRRYDFNSWWRHQGFRHWWWKHHHYDYYKPYIRKD